MIQLKTLLTEQFGRIDSELIVATTLVLEAGGEGHTGMDAVAHVIHNRANTNHNKWGTTAVKQVLRPYQFSMWNAYNAGKETWTDVLKKAQSRAEQWNYALPLAKKLVAGTLAGRDITNGATFYYNPTTANPDSLGFTKDPGWVEIKKIGRHVFGTIQSQKKTNNASSKTYTVKSGDTLGGIANRNGTTVDAIARKNPGLNADRIQPGQKIKL
jgi:nucleoid-associated protein YgaU